MDNKITESAIIGAKVELENKLIGLPAKKIESYLIELERSLGLDI